MNDAPFPDCPWTDRVSAMLDDEIHGAEHEMVRAHAAGCTVCSAVISAPSPQAERPGHDRVSEILSAIPERLSPSVRLSLVIAGMAILGASTPDFVRGNTMGDALHDLRHLAIWQVSVGVAVLSAAVTFRLSRLVTVMLTTFLGLTGAAAAYDAVTGHRGPWTDLTHVVEVVAVLLVLRLVWPRLRISTPRRRIPRVVESRRS